MANALAQWWETQGARERERERPPQASSVERERSAGSGGCIVRQVQASFFVFLERSPKAEKSAFWQESTPRPPAYGISQYLGRPALQETHFARRPKAEALVQSSAFAIDSSATRRGAAAKMKTYGVCYYLKHFARNVASPKAQTRSEAKIQPSPRRRRGLQNAGGETAPCEPNAQLLRPPMPQRGKSFFEIHSNEIRNVLASIPIALAREIVF